MKKDIVDFFVGILVGLISLELVYRVVYGADIIGDLSAGFCRDPSTVTFIFVSLAIVFYLLYRFNKPKIIIGGY